MDIRYIDPLSRGFRRMKKALFQPFDLKKWFVVGFTAFLATLTDCHGGNGGSGNRLGRRSDWYDVLYFPLRAWEWLLDHPGWFMLIIIGVFLLFILVVLFIWLSSRGKFMFLDNVVHDRAQVAKPWYEYKSQGNSLFLWSFFVGLLVLGLVVWYLLVCYSALLALYENCLDLEVLIVPAILMLLGFFAFMILVSFINLLLVDFVVPIMYRSKLRVLKAWRVFLPLFGRQLIYFVGYAFLILVLTIIIVIGIIAGGLVTCCLGFILLLIPYINAVVLLPVSYTMRAFSVEFLEQFGPEYHVFPRADSGQPGESLTRA